jgi:hypothetical protein
VLAREPSWRDALVDDPDLGPLVALETTEDVPRPG